MILLRALTRRWPAWDAPAKVALILALALFVLLLFLGFGGPEPIQMPARIGAFGLLLTLQLIFLWANRRDISPYHQAQQHFIAGDYQAARAVLEAIPESSRESVDALVLLGNCYRHLSLFDLSRAALERALQRKPNHHLALFSMGKLCIVRGDYALASDMVTAALEAGAPDHTRFELGQAQFLLGERELARANFNAVTEALADDPAQLLMNQYYLHELGNAPGPFARFIRAEIKHWKQEAVKYAGTAYAEHIEEVLAKLESLLALKESAAGTAADRHSTLSQ